MRNRILKFSLFFALMFSTTLFNSCFKEAEDNDAPWVEINGVKWATRNVDAPGTFTVNPEDAGMFYQWNRNIGWSSIDPMVSSTGDSDWDRYIDWTLIETEWKQTNDPSPAGYRVPAYEEIEKLYSNNVTKEWTTQNGVRGCKFTDTITGNSIFFPVVGYRTADNGKLNGVGSEGRYWSSTLDISEYVHPLVLTIRLCP